MVAKTEELSAGRKAEPLTDVSAPPGVSVGAKTEKPKPRSKGIFFLAFVALAGLAGGGYYYSRRGLESTDDAQVDGEVVLVPARASGIVTKVLFDENQRVTAGALIAVLDDAPAQARVLQAKARVAAAKAAADAADADARIASTNASGNSAVAKAQLSTASMGALTIDDQIREAQTAVKSAEVAVKQAKQDLDRSTKLFDDHAIAQAELDRSKTSYDLASTNLDAANARLSTLRLSRAQADSRVAEASAKATQVSDVDTLVTEANARATAAHAEVDSATAALDLALIDLANTNIYAPADGVLSKKSISVGQAVTAGQPIAQLVRPVVWVSANFKETQIEKMKLGQAADIEVDSFPDAKLRGEIESFSGATGSRFALLPPDNASGNFTKVVQRVPIRVRITSTPNGVELRPGMSVELTIHTR
jgi:membrane fusion protein, multidrug efflux system